MRTISGMMLTVVIGMLVGCGGSGESSPQPKPHAEESPKVETPAAPSPGAPAPTPASPPAWEMDPAKHAIPASPVKGKLAGADFAPEALVQGESLHLRVLDKDGIPEREVVLKLPADQAKAAAEGLKLVVKPDQSPGPDVPEIMTVFPPAKQGDPGANAYVNGYALTLELGKRDKRKVPGKIFLSLPGDEKDFLAGTFTADWVRSPAVPPGPEDAPFIQGSLKVSGVENPTVKVGYAAQPTAEAFAFDAIQMSLMGPGWARSEHMKPRISTLVAAEGDKPARYEHIHLTPGRYLVYAAIDGGPAAWKWLDLPADGKVTADLSIDATKAGSLEVKVGEGLGDTVRLAPADEPGKRVPPGLILGIALSLNLEQKVKDGAVKFEKLAAGRYEVLAGDASEIVEIKPGETTTVTLAKKNDSKK